MKKKIFIAVLVIIVLGVFCSIFYFKFIHKDNKKINNHSNYLVYEKKASIQGEDGWYYFFYLNGVDDTSDKLLNITDIEYFFDAINLKYETLPGYEIEKYIINEKGEKEKVGGQETYPTLSVSLKEKNGVREKDEIFLIDEYFTKKQFNREITIEDLKDLELQNFDKKLLTELYNKMINQEYSSKLTKFEVYLGEYRKDDMLDDYQWHTSMLALRTGALEIYIDVIYKNGTYLSDLVKNNKASKKQIEMYNNIQLISKYIIDNQSVEFDSQFDDLKANKDYARLFTILDTYDNGWIK